MNRPSGDCPAGWPMRRRQLRSNVRADCPSVWGMTATIRRRPAALPGRARDRTARGPSAARAHAALPAGDGWSVLVPEGKPWRKDGPPGYGSPAAEHGTEPVDRVLAGWATALAVGLAWPVLALWWDGDRSGCTLAVGLPATGRLRLARERHPGRRGRGDADLRRPAGPRPRTGRPGPWKPSPARTRRRTPAPGCAACSRSSPAPGSTLPPGLTPGEPADRLRSVAAIRPAGGADRVGRLARRGAGGTRRGRARQPRPLGARAARRGPLATAQVAAGLPAHRCGAAPAQRRLDRGGPALLLVQGALGLAYDRFRGEADRSRLRSGR